MTRTAMTGKIEILAPGGDADAVRAAILAGADAVYCGLGDFNARRRAANISPDEMAALVRTAHRHDCRIFLTLNTLVLDTEFDRIVSILNDIRSMDVDAVIVQDPGILYVLKKYFPGMEVHASTQMTTHNRGQVEFLSRLGVMQVNLARELSLEEIEPLCAYAHGLHMRIEVFVHGAYCISFSGQCYMSTAMSGLSGNRGACVQPCRRNYVSGSGRRICAPFNLKDNSAFPDAAGLARAGVDSLKIEGRIKNFRYVYTTVTAWRKQIDLLQSTGQIAGDDPSLYRVFNRRFTDGYLRGRISRDMFIDTSRDQSLVLVSVIAGYSADDRMLSLEEDGEVEPGATFLIYTDDFTFICTGAIESKAAPRRYVLRIEHKLQGKILKGQILYIQPDRDAGDDLTRRIDELENETVALSLCARGAEGKNLELDFSAGEHRVTVTGSVPLTKARSELSLGDIIREKAGQLGGTGYTLGRCDFSALDDGLFIPVKEINDMRRRAVAALSGVVETPQPVSLPVMERRRKEIKTPALACLVSDPADIALKRIPGITVMFELPPRLPDGGGEAARLLVEHPGVVPWFPAILIDEDFTAAVDLLDRVKPRLVVSDNTGLGIEASRRNIPWMAGPMLNCANSYSLRAMGEFAGSSGAFLSWEPGRDQVRGISAPEDFHLWYVIYGPTLLMNTRQCLVRNCVPCGKDVMDEACLPGCSRKATVHDREGNPLHLVKRPGFHNQLYSGRNWFNPSAVTDLPGLFDGFLADLRDIGTATVMDVPKEVFLEALLSLVRGDTGAGKVLRSMVRNVTCEQYNRGL